MNSSLSGMFRPISLYRIPSFSNYSICFSADSSPVIFLRPVNCCWPHISHHLGSHPAYSVVSSSSGLFVSVKCYSPSCCAALDTLWSSISEAYCFAPLVCRWVRVGHCAWTDSSCYYGLYVIQTYSRTCFAWVADRRAGCHVFGNMAIELSGRSSREAHP